MIEFTIPGDPIPQGRPRARRAGDKIIMYDPKESKEYKEYVAMIARQYAPKQPLDGELSMTIKIYRQIPKSTPKKLKELYKARIKRPIVKPDSSNYAKPIEDALNKIIYNDDSQIVDLHVHKYYSDDPRVEVTIKDLSLLDHADVR